LTLAGALLVGACGSPDGGPGAGEDAQDAAVADTAPDLLAWGSEAAQQLHLDQTWTTDLDSMA
jgi:hypothetical protein